MIGIAIIDPEILLKHSEAEQNYFIRKMKEQNPTVSEYKLKNKIIFLKNKIIYNDLLKLLLGRK